MLSDNISEDVYWINVYHVAIAGIIQNHRFCLYCGSISYQAVEKENLIVQQSPIVIPITKHFSLF